MKITDVIHAGVAFFKAGLGKCAPPEEINARAEICKTCPAKQEIDSLDSEVSLMLGKMVNSDRAPKELTNNRCGVCHCALILLVPAEMKDIQHDLEDDTEFMPRPETCWIKKP